MRMPRLKSHITTILIAIVLLTMGSGVAAKNAFADGKNIIYFILITPPNPQAREGMISWFQFFRNNIDALVAGLRSPKDLTPNPDASDIDVRSQEVVSADRNDLVAWWHSAPRVLHALRAVTFQSENSTIIDADIYLGSLKGSLNDAFVHINQVVVMSKYRVNRDAVSIITLYAYAMSKVQEQKDPKDNYLICQALEKAYLYRDGLDDELRAELANLLQALVDGLQIYKCGGVS